MNTAYTNIHDSDTVSAPAENNAADNEDGFVLTALRQHGLTHKPADWQSRLEAVTEQQVLAELAAKPAYSPERLFILMSPAAGRRLEDLAKAAYALTRRRFGNAITLFAPLYVSNFCINRCRYCGFNAGQQHRRLRLSVEEALGEARIIAKEGFRDILLVSGEDKRHIDVDYLARLGEALRRDNLFSSVSVEIYIQPEESYRRLFAAGVDGVTVFQETYDEESYAFWHGGGPKAIFKNRINGQEAAARAGMRRLGLGVLLGLEDWRFDAMAMAMHAHVLMRHYWRAKVSFSFPRICPTESGAEEKFRYLMSDAELAQLLTALRLTFPDAGMTLSTRERPGLREHLIPLGITQISAGSKTNPGGYGEKDHVAGATEQFAVSDERSAAEMAAVLRTMGFDPVWKDWDAGFQG